MDIEQYLRENFPDVSSVEAVTVDGVVKGYYANGVNGSDQLYIPVSALDSSSVGMVSYIPGAGGSGNDAAALRDRIQNDPPDYIVSIAASCGDKHDCISTGYEAAEGLNINVTNSVTICFSASGYVGIEHTEEFLEQHPEITSTIISCEPYPYGSSDVYSGDISAMVDSGTKIIFVAPNGFHINMEDEIAALTSSGLDAVWLQTNYSGDTGGNHIATSRDILSSGIIDYILGYADDFNHDPGGSQYDTGYQLIGYDKETGKLIVVDYSDLIQSGIGVLRIPDLKKLKAIDSFEIKTKASPVTSKYAVLKDLTTDSKITSKSGRVISSEYEYVSTSMNNLKSQIKKSSFLTGFSNLGFRSSSGIPGCIASYINAYFDIVGCLMNDLSLEADAIISYGQAYVDMEDDIKKGVDKIGTIVEMDNSSKYIAIGLPKEEEEEEKKNTKKNTGTKTTGGSSYPSGGYSGGGSSSSTSSTTESTTSTKPATDSIIEVIPTVPTQAPTTVVVEQPQTFYYPETPAPVVSESVEPSVSSVPVSSGEDMAPTDIVVQGDMKKGETVIGGMSEDVITKKPTITQIPTSSEPLEPSSSSKKGNGIIPVIAGLSVAAAAGIGAKAYIDHKKNNENDDADDVDLEEYSDDYEYDTDSDEEFQYKENTDPEFQEEVESYTSRNTDDLMGY